MGNPDNPSFGPRIPEQTVVSNAQVFVDGALLSHLGQALLGRKKILPRPSPDDCSGNDEELTHLFVGDRGACVKAANEIAGMSAGTLFGPQCGRSGREVKVIRCLDDKPPEEPITYAAIAVHYLCERDAAETLDANPILLTSKAPSSWEADFRRSYLANCTDDDSAGGLPRRENSPTWGAG